MVMTNHELLKSAYELATFSPDPSTQIGAFLISPHGQMEYLTRAYNNPTRDWDMSASDWGRPRKYDLMCHAERGSLDKAARFGICTAGTTMVASWAACADCARGIVACGVRKLVRHVLTDGPATPGWEDSVSIGDEIMRVGGVELVDVHGTIPGAPTILRAGQPFNPALELVND